MMCNRRRFLAAAGWAIATLPSCPPSGETATPEASHEFVPYVVGANTAITGWDFFEAVNLLRDLGYRTIEVQNLIGALDATPGRFPGFRYDEISRTAKDRILSALEPFDHVTVHLPYEDWMPYVDSDDHDGVAFLETCLDAAGFLGAKVAVLHPQPKGTDLKMHWKTAVERIRLWGAMAADQGFQLAVETSVPNSIPELVRFHEEINHDYVGITLDVGHQAGFDELAHIAKQDYTTPDAIRAYNDVNIAIVEALGDKLIHLHTHDIEPATWDEHKPLIHGFIDYPRLISKLHEARYSGVLVFEIGGDPAKMPGWLREAKCKMDAYVAI